MMHRKSNFIELHEHPILSFIWMQTKVKLKNFEASQTIDHYPITVTGKQENFQSGNLLFSVSNFFDYLQKASELSLVVSLDRDCFIIKLIWFSSTNRIFWGYGLLVFGFLRFSVKKLLLLLVSIQKYEGRETNTCLSWNHPCLALPELPSTLLSSTGR